MDDATVLVLGRDMLLLTLMLSLPVMAVGMSIGLLVSIFQAMTQIQEQTLTFVPKIVGILLAILVMLPWTLRTMVDYTVRLMEEMAYLVN